VWDEGGTGGTRLLVASARLKVWRNLKNWGKRCNGGNLKKEGGVKIAVFQGGSRYIPE